MSGLDVNTPRGQVTLAEEQEAVNLFTGKYPHLQYVETPKGGPATVDALLVREDGTLSGVVETKCRQMTREQLERFGNTWLITWDKVDGARRIAEALGVPLYGFLYLVPDKTLLTITLSDATGLLSREITIEASQTQRTVNGGQIVRNNAYVSMAGCQTITVC